MLCSHTGRQFSPSPRPLPGGPLSLSSVTDQAGASLPNPHPGHPHPADDGGDGKRWSTCEFSSVQFSSVTQSCPILCEPMNHSTPGLPVHDQLPESTQTHVH